MPHFYPVVLPSGKSLAGDSLGFHAYSLRIDNLTNQWLLEETSLAWIPPYSLGVCLRLYGTGVGIILNQAPIGQPQLAPVIGEQAIGVYSDQIRTEVAGSPVRQFSLVQSVSDLTQGPQPALPVTGVDRLWADTQGNIHHLHVDGSDYQLFDIHNINAQMPPGGVLAGSWPSPSLVSGAAAANVGSLGGVLTGTLPNPGIVPLTRVALDANRTTDIPAGTGLIAGSYSNLDTSAAWSNNIPGSILEVAVNAVATIQAPAGSFALVGLLAVIGPTRYLMGVAWVPAGTTGPLVGAITVFAPSSVIGTAGILIQYYSFQAGATIAMRCASYPQFEGLHYTVLEHHS